MQTHTLCLHSNVAYTRAANVPPAPQTHLSMGTIKSMKFEHAALTKKALLFLRKQKLGKKNEFFNLERAAPRLTDTQNNHILPQIPVAGTGRAHLRPSTGYSEKGGVEKCSPLSALEAWALSAHKTAQRAARVIQSGPSSLNESVHS